MNALSNATMLSLAASAALLAGCSGSATAPASPSIPNTAAALSRTAPDAFVSRASLAGLLPPQYRSLVGGGGPDHTSGWPDVNLKAKIFVSLFNAGLVNGYDEEGVLRCRIAGLKNPAGLATDAQGNLYVAEYSGADVRSFKPGCGPLRGIYNDPGYLPVDVTTSPTTGNVYVSNYVTVAGAPGNIECYIGFGNPNLGCGPLTDPAAIGYFFLAEDTLGNLFSTFLNANKAGQIDCYAASVMPSHNLGVALGYPGGIDSINPNKIAVVDQVGANAGIRTFVGKNCPPQVAWAQFGPTILSGANDWLDLSLDSVSAELERTDVTAGNANQITYPAGAPDDAFVAGLNVAGMPFGVTQQPHD